MEEEITRRLVELNRAFYSQFAREFSETRSASRVSLVHILPYLVDGGKVLDVGCGNGRLAQRLDREDIHLTYFGIDQVEQFVDMAGTLGPRLENLCATFRVLDIIQPNWGSDFHDFDIAIVLAVLHHIPSFDLRVQVMSNIRMALKSTGRMVMTNWKFDKTERLRRKIVPWSSIGLEEDQLEPGDALVSWNRGGAGYRYVHMISPEEVEGLAREAGFKIEKQFYADAGLNLYSILEF